LQLLNFAFEKCVVFNFLSHKDYTFAGNGVSWFPVKFSILLFLAINNHSYRVSFDANSKPVPITIVQAGTEFDNLPFASFNAPVVKFESMADLEGHNFFPLHIVDGKEHFL